MLALLLALSITQTFSYPADAYKNGYYAGRSADIVVDTDFQNVEIQLPWQLSYEDKPVTEVQDVHVYNLVSRALGLPQVHLPDSYAMERQLDDNVPFSFFTTKRSNIFFSIDGLTSEFVPSSTKVLGRTPVYTVSQSSRPYNSYSMLTTLLTGTQPRRHGVLNKFELARESKSILDVAKELSSDSLIVSGSLKNTYLNIFAPQVDGLNYFWNTKTSSWEKSGESSSPVVISEKSLNSLVNSDGLPYKVKSKTTTVKVDDVIFDLTEEADNSLFQEIIFVASWSSFLNQSPAHMNFFSFHFSSLALIAAKYGRDSEKWIKAVSLIDSTINGMCGNGAILEIVYLPVQSSSSVSSIISTIVPTGLVAHEDFPQYYLTSEAQGKQQQFCEQIKKALGSQFPGATVFCPTQTSNLKRSIESVNQVMPINMAPITASITTVLEFHYVFWTMMVCIAALCWAIYAIAYIEPDESLYTSSTYFKKGKAL